MTSTVKVITTGEYEVYYEEHVRNITHTPFHTPLWVRFQATYFGDVFYFLSIEEEGIMKAGLAIFELKTPNGELFYTYGRYGTAGLILNHADLEEAFKLFSDKIVKDIAPSTLAISIGNLQTNYDSLEEAEKMKAFCDEKDGRQYFSRANHVVDVKNITDELGSLNFRDYKKRSNLSRNLKGARKAGLTISEISDEQTLKAWHKVHLERTAELGGKSWPLEFFLLAIKPELGKLSKFFSVWKERTLVGGAFCLRSPKTLDIFMMSTLRDYQSQGANHLLTEAIYLWCAKEGISYVNWQGSNPPEGGVAQFKEQWMAKRHIMHSVNMIVEKKKFNATNKEELLDKHPDRFFYPFS